MKSLQNKLRECSLYEGFYKNAGGMVQPRTKEELEKEIDIRLNRDQTNLNDIDTSKITDMSRLFFSDKRDLSKLDISKWDTSNVTDMHNMFYNCFDFNCDLSKWDVSNVEDMSSMFDRCTNFNSDLSRWNVSKVKDMKYMFYGCRNFKSDLSKWNVSNTTNMYGMFVYSGIGKHPDWYRN